ncbi:hypothetical protein [Pseudomonas sp. P1.8]|uniref:hypothetical protein n=1 Tax=Pseudomonas sp. P1.8 TaxID=1699310 RepID=UPI00069E43AB|nr:hypothetical protein [Pseudomonas sp. P1.8]
MNALANAQRKISPNRFTGLPGQPSPMILSGFLLPDVFYCLPVGAAEGCDLLILISYKQDQKIAAFRGPVSG